MPRLDYKRCRNCKKHVDEVGVLSHSCLCARCGADLAEQAARDLATHSGPKFVAWRRGMAASVGATFLDDAPVKP